MTPHPTIAVVHASVGSGHRIAAESIAVELQKQSPETRVRILDILDFSAVQLSGDSAAGVFTGRLAPVYNIAWGSPTLGRAAMAAARPGLALAFARFSHWLREHKPDAVIATHALAANLALHALREGDLASTPVIAVATDFGIHGYWPRRGLALFCVADEASARELASRGNPERSIAVTGIPVRPQFVDPIDPLVTKEHLELPANRKLLLALAGASMPKPYVHFKEALATALPAMAGLPDTNVVVVTGRDAEFADRLRRSAVGLTKVNTRILGYAEDMASLMAAADLGICKPGGLVAAECMDSGLPVVLVGPSVGQERANVHALVRAGAAASCEDPSKLTEVVRKTIADHDRLEKMRKATLRLAKPHAARDIADKVLAVVKRSSETQQ